MVPVFSAFYLNDNSNMLRSSVQLLPSLTVLCNYQVLHAAVLPWPLSRASVVVRAIWPCKEPKRERDNA